MPLLARGAYASLLPRSIRAGGPPCLPATSPPARGAAAVVHVIVQPLLAVDLAAGHRAGAALLAWVPESDAGFAAVVRRRRGRPELALRSLGVFPQLPLQALEEALVLLLGQDALPGAVEGRTPRKGRRGGPPGFVDHAVVVVGGRAGGRIVEERRGRAAPSPRAASGVVPGVAELLGDDVRRGKGAGAQEKKGRAGDSWDAGNEEMGGEGAEAHHRRGGGGKTRPDGPRPRPSRG